MAISIDDDAALRAKVEEALNVYDEYMKSKGGEPDVPGDSVKPKDSIKEGASEEIKS
jgi:polyadenylate-binding protein